MCPNEDKRNLEYITFQYLERYTSCTDFLSSLILECDTFYDRWCTLSYLNKYVLHKWFRQRMKLKKNLTSVNASIYILHSVLSIFSLVMTRRICLTIWSLLDWWSSPLFSWLFIWFKSNTVRRNYKPVTLRAQKITSIGHFIVIYLVVKPVI